MMQQLKEWRLDVAIRGSGGTAPGGGLLPPVADRMDLSVELLLMSLPAVEECLNPCNTAVLADADIKLHYKYGPTIHGPLRSVK